MVDLACAELWYFSLAGVGDGGEEGSKLVNGVELMLMTSKGLL